MRAAARPARRRTPASVASRTPGHDTSSFPEHPGGEGRTGQVLTVEAPARGAGRP